MKNKFNWRSESGVSQLGIILGIMIAGGVAGKFALDRSNEVSQVHQLAKSNNTRSIYQESIVSSLGISKVLFKPNNGEPAIYAENYFANDWNLLENTVVASKQWKLEGNDIKIIAPNPASADFDSFFKGKKDTVSLDNNVKLVELIVDNAPPFEFRHKAIVEATVIGSDKRPMKINAMIDLPEPPDPSIAISGAPPTTYDSPFTGPKVKVDINVKGIASSGKVYLNGQQIEILDMSQSRNHKSEFLAGSLNLDNRDNSRVVKVGVCEWKEPSEEPVEYQVRVEVQDVKGDLIVHEESIFMKKPSNYAQSVAMCPEKCADADLKWRDGVDDKFITDAIVCLSNDESGSNKLMYAASAPACEPKFLQERNECGCFAEDTKIQMADMSYKSISRIKAGDKVFNPITKKAMEIEHMTVGPENLPMIEVRIGDKKLEVTGNHPFPTPFGIVPAFELKEGQPIRVNDDWVNIDAVTMKESMTPPQVWNIMIKAGSNLKDHMLMANGMVTGDLLVQSKLEQGRINQSDLSFNK